MLSVVAPLQIAYLLKKLFHIYRWLHVTSCFYAHRCWKIYIHVCGYFICKFEYDLKSIEVSALTAFIVDFNKIPAKKPHTHHINFEHKKKPATTKEYRTFKVIDFNVFSFTTSLSLCCDENAVSHARHSYSVFRSTFLRKQLEAGLNMVDYGGKCILLCDIKFKNWDTKSTDRK